LYDTSIKYGKAFMVVKQLIIAIKSSVKSKGTAKIDKIVSYYPIKQIALCKVVHLFLN
jgi:hypothetical protein